MDTPYTLELWFKFSAENHPDSGFLLVIKDGFDALFLDCTSYRLFVLFRGKQYFGPHLEHEKSATWTMINYVVSDSGLSIYLNAECVLEINSGVVAQSVDKVWLHPQRHNWDIIESDLSEWNLRRQQLFLYAEEPRQGRVALSEDAQILQLSQRMQALQMFAEAARSNNWIYLDDMLSTLRALLAFIEGRRSYNPLLLRVAAIKRKTLPVYSLHSDDSFRTLVNEKLAPGMKWGFVNIPLISPCPPHILELDFQSFLEAEFFYYEDKFYTPISFLLAAANTESASHYDRTVHEFLQQLKLSPEICGLNPLKGAILALANLTVGVGKALV